MTHTRVIGGTARAARLAGKEMEGLNRDDILRAVVVN